jgi:hypothetical protein
MRLLLAALVLSAQDDEVARLQKKVQAARPTEAELSYYSHNWAPSLKEARERAAKEKRPIFFIAVTNITGPDNVFSGHC